MYNKTTNYFNYYKSIWFYKFCLDSYTHYLMAVTELILENIVLYLKKLKSACTANSSHNTL